MVVKNPNYKYKTHTPEYKVWISMRERCGNPNSKDYKYYGARGIVVCGEWQNSFECFLGDIGLKPSKTHEIDRIDNNQGYFPENCRWVTRLESRRNRKYGIGGEENASIIKFLLIIGVSRERISELTGFHMVTLRDLETEKTFKGVEPFHVSTGFYSFIGKDDYDEKICEDFWQSTNAKESK